MRIPKKLHAELNEAGLPLGPLAEPLVYLATPSGNLHSSPRCRRISKGVKRRLQPRTVDATEVGYGKLCQGCWTRLPGRADDHARWCDHAQFTFTQLAKAGVSSPFSTAYDRVAEQARAQDVTWEHVAGLDLALAKLAGHGMRGNTLPPVPELARILTELSSLVASTRSDLAARLTAQRAATEPGERRVIAIPYYRARMESWKVDRVHELFAQCDLVADLSYWVALAFAPADVAQRLTRAEDLGLAEPWETRDVLETALRLLRQSCPGDPVAVPDDEYRNALHAARLVHAPAA